MLEQFVKFLHLKSTAPVEFELILQFLKSFNDILTSYMHRLNVTENYSWSYFFTKQFIQFCLHFAGMSRQHQNVHVMHQVLRNQWRSVGVASAFTTCLNMPTIYIQTAMITDQDSITSIEFVFDNIQSNKDYQIKPMHTIQKKKFFQNLLTEGF